MKRCYVCFAEFPDAYQVCPQCGEIENNQPAEPIHLTPGTILAGRYILGRAVGAGGFGIVYRAWDSKLETIVAVKEFFPSRFVTRAGGLKNPIVTKKSQEEYEYRKKRFLAEARTMAKFGSHKSIPNVFEFFEENNTAYIVMELLKGITLSDYIHQHNGKIDPEFAVMIATEVGNALKSLHDEQIIHRDVAPDNIYICSGKEIRIKLMDLGAAKLAENSDEVKDIILKPGYSPPEQYDNSKNIGPLTDIYALGATLYIMLTGIKPDESTNRKIHDTVVPPHLLDPSISENLSNAVMKAMALEQHMRFKNATEFLEAISGERKVISLEEERRRKKRKRLLGVVAACAVLAGFGFAGYKVLDTKQSEKYLKAADISVWFSVAEGSKEETAMESVKSDFEATFPDVKIQLRAIPEKEYMSELQKAAAADQMPTLFESSGLPDSILEQARDLKPILKSEPFKTAMFLDQYDRFYSDRKKMPLAIEVPVAFLVTRGAESIRYEDHLFSTPEDFHYDKIALDALHTDLILANYPDFSTAFGRNDFMNNEHNTSAVLLSSTMEINTVRTTLTNYEKSFVYPEQDKIFCNYIYEWSICGKEEAEIAAGERLLSWMLGNVYQSYLMVSQCQDGQIPVNPICFENKIQSQYLSSLKDISAKLVFERNGKSE